MASRFAFSSEESVEERRLSINAQKTLKANKSAAKILKEYLVEIGKSADFEILSAEQLDIVLGRFWMDIWRVDGSTYKINSLESIRHGINRYLKNPPFNKKFDIIKDPNFVNSNTNFKAVLMELKREGKGEIQHFPVISEEDMHKLYSSIHMDTSTPQGLYNKVQFDIRLYFCRRGNENMYSMTKSTFNVQTDQKTGLKYVKKVQDELTKNHRMDKESTSGVMPEKPGSVYCPVLSFEKYMSKLHPDCNKIWQRTRDSFLSGDDVWYCNVPVGEKKLKSFMSSLSIAAGLSKTYTNHSVRATGATILSKSMFGPSQVMSVTGHKSVQSLSVYQRVDDYEKVQMGQAICANISPPEVALNGDQHLPLNDIMNTLEGVNPDDIFSEFEAPGPSHTNSTPTSGPVFNNCKVTWINNVVIQK